MTLKLNRRDFIKNAMASVAAVTLERSSAGDAQTRSERLTLSNDQIVWEFSLADQKISSIGIQNKLSGKYYPLKQASELRLTFSAAKARVEIPWWRCTFGPDDDRTPPQEERGYREGYHQREFDDTKWQTCSNLCLHDLSAGGSFPRNQSRPAVVYHGYGWFRTWFELPTNAQGEEIVLNLGGYDQTDWNEYWVYVNGIEIGRRSLSGRWRTPGQFRLFSNSPAYQALRFGGSNLLAIRTYSYDRHFDGLSDDVLDRYIFDTVLYDQFVTVGTPYLHIVDFEVTAIRREQKAEGPGLVIELVNRNAQIRAIVHYELRGPIRRKWVEVRNEAPERKLLLDVDLDSFETEGASAEGGYGYPVTIDDQLFCSVEHPSGLNRGDGQKISLTHFPGKWLNPGETWQSHNTIVGVAPAGGVNQYFLDYIEAYTVRKKKILALYDPFGITAFPEGMSWALNDYQNLGVLNLLAKWQKKGVRFDYYIPDMSLDTTSDLKHFRLFSFPDGAGEVIQRVNELGMKFGQWFAVSHGAWSNYRHPKTAPSRIPNPGGTAQALFRHGYVVGQIGYLCIASEPYFTMLKDAILYHIKENHVELIKLDTGHYYCNSTEHEHLPGKYSTEESFNRLIELTKAARSANPDIFVVWYWGAYSPFFALHGDVIFDIRLSMEACSTGDYPALFFRDAVNQALDQGAQFAKWVPPMNHDSLGVWLANNWWGNYMGTERWQEAVIMDLARGNLLFPQIWSDLYNLEDHDVEFLARIQDIVKRNERVFLTRRHKIGDPWKDEIYGYSYFEGEHGFVFLNNVSFECRKAKLDLGEKIGLLGAKGKVVRLRTHHPSEMVLTRNGNADFRVGEVVEIQLRPFEVIMIEVQPAATAESGLPSRETIIEILGLPHYSYNVPIRKTSNIAGLQIHFADAEELLASGLKKGVSTFEAILPEYIGGRYHIAIVNTLRKNGRWWRQSQISKFIQAIATVDDMVIEFMHTPDFRQMFNNQWNPWIVFSAPLPQTFRGRPIRFGISSYLPEDVEITTDLWVIKEWWRPRMRPLPNYWV